MLYQKNKKNKGFSLLELILAVGIFSLASFGMATLLIDSNISTRFDTERIAALSYAKEGVEATRSIRDTDWDSLADGTYGLVASSSGMWEFSAIPESLEDKFTRTVTVAPFSTSTKNVSVSISWPLTSARIATTTLNTILTNWQYVAPVPGATLGDGLINHWTMNDNDITTVVTESVGEINAIASDNTSLITSSGATINTGTSFDFAGTYCVNGNVAHTTAANSIGAYAFWFKMNSLNASKLLIDDRGYLRIIYDHIAQTIKTLNGSGPEHYLNTTLITGNWYHFVLNYSGPDNVAELWLDGTREVLTTSNSPDFDAGVGAGYSFGIGCNLFFGEVFDGVMDDVRFYNRFLNSDEIAELVAGTEAE